MKLKSLINEMEIDKTIEYNITFIFKECTELFSIIPENLIEGIDLEKEFALLAKKKLITTTCRYPAHSSNKPIESLSIDERKNGLLILSDDKAFAAFKSREDFIKLANGIKNSFREKMGIPQYNECIKALRDQYQDYQKIIQVYNLENSKKGSAKDDDCTGAFCDLPDAEEIFILIKKHMTEFIEFLQNTFKDWDSMPIAIPQLVESLNSLFIQNITVRKLLNVSNLELGFKILEENFNSIHSLIENSIENTNDKTKEVLTKLNHNVVQFATLLKDTKLLIQELEKENIHSKHKEKDKKIIKDVTIKITKYDFIVKSLNKKIARLNN